MPILTYEASGFPSGSPPSLQGTNTINVTWPTIVRAALTVGKLPFFWHGSPSSTLRSEYRMRAGVVGSALVDKLGLFQRSPNYAWLDRSEKAVMSYFLGMSVSKLLADLLLNVPWLVHLDLVRNLFNIQIPSTTRSRPDLIGLTTSGDWSLVEAKGRSALMRLADLEPAKAQLSLVTSIAGAVPTIRAAVGAHFAKDVFQAHIVDPRGSSNDLDEHEFGRREFFHAYYGWLIDMLMEDQFDLAWRDIQPFGRFRIWRAPDLDLEFGVSQALLDMRGSPDDVQPVAGHEDPLLSVGRDHTVVRLGARWEGGEMRRRPDRRGTPRKSTSSKKHPSSGTGVQSRGTRSSRRDD